MTSDHHMSSVFVSVGSNIEPKRNIVAALCDLVSRGKVVATSTFYRTAPVGPSGQPQYVNGVWWLETQLTPTQIKVGLLRPIEHRLGRIRVSDKFAPRTIDLDMILYDDLSVAEEGLILPHPDIVRPFVYWPVLELLEDHRSRLGEDLYRRIQAILNYPEPAKPESALPELTGCLRDLLRG
jgi:2-amino-4-hydroxy-6-hydroxymethyldihydropteridine diphosphokinase